MKLGFEENNNFNFNDKVNVKGAIEDLDELIVLTSVLNFKLRTLDQSTFWEVQTRIEKFKNVLSNKESMKNEFDKEFIELEKVVRNFHRGIANQAQAQAIMMTPKKSSLLWLKPVPLFLITCLLQFLFLQLLWR
jgi:hypothetical protein